MRLLRHLFARSARRLFPEDSLHRITDAIAAGERLHRGEVMFAVDDEAHPRVLSVMGGKLTTYRATAQAALLRLEPSLPTKERRADTALVSLIPVH